MKTRIIGDIHGKIHSYKKLLDGVQNSIQIGDYGIGFNGPNWHDDLSRWQKTNPNHRFIRGNHDDPDRCITMPNFIPDGTIQNDVMYVGGAWSIDRDWRIEGLDWWPNEELSYEELDRMISVYDLVRPRVMITHDCPESVSYQLFIATGETISGGVQHKTRTAQAFEAMFEIHKPDLWIFGHWHGDRDVYIKNTRFICLDELRYADVDFDTLELIKCKDFGKSKITW